MRALPHEIAIGFFDGRWDVDGRFSWPDPRSAYADSDEALQFLQDLTGEKIGKDAVKWEAWFANCPTDLLSLLYDEYTQTIQSVQHPDFSQRLSAANERWKNTTRRLCPNCTALCPEYREHCWACGFRVGRKTSDPRDSR